MSLPDPLGNDPEARAARNRRSLAIAVGLALFMILVFAVTVTRMGSSVMERPL